MKKDKNRTDAFNAKNIASVSTDVYMSNVIGFSEHDKE